MNATSEFRDSSRQARHQKILVWDLPVRVFHWLLVISFAGTFLTAESERLRNLHVAFGYTTLGLIAFRLLWGVLGTRYARFSAFAFGPRHVISYLKSLTTFRPQHYIGHNPAGSWAIYALFALILLTDLTGYLTFNDIGGDWLEELHEGSADALLALVIVHVLGVLVSSVMHRENLVRAMLSGYKWGDRQEAIRQKHRAIAAALLLAVGAFWLGNGTKVLPWLKTQAQLAKYESGHRHHDRAPHIFIGELRGKQRPPYLYSSPRWQPLQGLPLSPLATSPGSCCCVLN